MMIHPKARPVISKLPLPSPIKKYFSHLNWEIDLSNNTNPYIGEFSDYPDVRQDSLKDLYLKMMYSLNPPPSFKIGSQKDLTSENILFTAGSMEGLDLLLRTFCEPNKDTICVSSPSFSAYEHWALIHNLRVTKISLFGDNLDQLALEEVSKINPKMVFLCDPNNPTGTRLSPEFIQKLCESLEGFVVVDEAYIEFSDHPSSIFYLSQYKNLIIRRTFSKAWGLAGVRFGSIIADQSIIHALRYVQLPFAVSSLSQMKVEERLVHPEKTFASWQRIKRDREELIQNLSTMENISKIFKSETNFIMLIFKDFHKVMKLLEKHKIHVLDCSASLTNSIRVSLGTQEQNQKFLEVMQKAG